MQSAQLVKEADWHVHFLNGRVGRSLADVRLAVDHRLSRNFFAFKRGDLYVHAARLGALDGDQERQLVDGYDIAKSIPDFDFVLRRCVAAKGADKNEENHKTDNRFRQLGHRSASCVF